MLPSGGGRFEVSVDGTPVWSKKETGKFPTTDQITAALAESSK